MHGSKADALIRQWGGRFRKDPLAAAVVAGLKQRSGEIWQGTFRLLQQESPEYRNSVDDEFTKESKSHCGELLRAIIAVAAERAERSGSDPFDFVRTHAQWRAPSGAADRFAARLPARPQDLLGDHARAIVAASR
jgi:hypothetical protein